MSKVFEATRSTRERQRDRAAQKSPDLGIGTWTSVHQEDLILKREKKKKAERRNDLKPKLRVILKTYK